MRLSLNFVVIKTCEIIQNFTPDARSRKTLQVIAARKEAATALAVILGNSVFYSIFFKASSAEAAYNITNTDWELWAHAMNQIPKILKRSIESDALAMWEHYQFNYNREHIIFWKNFHGGCSAH